MNKGSTLMTALTGIPLVVFLVIISVAVNTMHSEQTRVLNAAFKDNINASMIALENQSRQLIATFDWPLIEELQKTAAQGDGVVALWIEDSLSGKKFGKVAENPKTLPQTHYHIRPISSDGEVIGAVHMVMSTQTLNAALSSSERSALTVVSTGILFATVVFAIFLIVRRRIAKRIEEFEVLVARTTKELHVNEEFLSAVLENIPAAVVLRRRNGTFLRINREYENIYGLTNDSVYGKSLSEIHPREMADQYSAFDQAVLEQGQVFRTELTVDLADGAQYFDMVKFPILDTDGEIVAIGGINHDITDRKRAGQKLHDAFDIISSSISYASRIQRSVLPNKSVLESFFEDYFILWKPRDVVGGDIYWTRKWGDGVLFILGDCTGHGVPGAFMTLISIGAMDRALSEIPVGDVGPFVQRVHQMIQLTLGQDSGGAESDDGLELGACFISPQDRALTFVGARFDLFMVTDDVVVRHKGDDKGIGYEEVPQDVEFNEIRISFSPSTSFYMTTDGAVDQISEERRRSFGKRRFEALLLEIQNKPMAQQEEAIYGAVLQHQGTAPRLDDIAVIGFKVA